MPWGRIILVLSEPRPENQTVATPAAQPPGSKLTPVQMVGFLCWRAGLLLVSGYSLFRVARYLVAYVDLPVQLEVGFALGLAGGVMVLVSVILEQGADERSAREGRA